MSITAQPHTSHPTRTGVIAGMCVALAAGAALAVASWGGHDTDSPAPEQPSYAEQIAALSDEELAGAFNYTDYPLYVQIAALSDEELAGAFNYTDYTVDQPSHAEQIAALSDEQFAGAFNYTNYAIPNDEQIADSQGNMPLTDEPVNARIAEALAAGDLDLSASFAFGDAAVYSGHG
jgi:hypothetical protein